MIKEILADTKRRMDNLGGGGEKRNGGDPNRSGFAGHPGRSHGRLLRHIRRRSIKWPTWRCRREISSPYSPGRRLSCPFIEKAILSSDLDLNPANDGKILRIPIPPLTEERRKLLVKHVGKLTEDGRTAVRQVRRDANDRLKKMLKDKEISEDDEKRALKSVQRAHRRAHQEARRAPQEKGTGAHDGLALSRTRSFQPPGVSGFHHDQTSLPHPIPTRPSSKASLSTAWTHPTGRR